jgi:hypothetical protein
MPIYIAIILIGIVVALIINFIPKKTDPSLEENVIIPELTLEVTQSSTPEPEPTPEVETLVIVDKPIKKIQSQSKKKSTKKPNKK